MTYRPKCTSQKVPRRELQRDSTVSASLSSFPISSPRTSPSFHTRPAMLRILWVVCIESHAHGSIWSNLIRCADLGFVHCGQLVRCDGVIVFAKRRDFLGFLHGCGTMIWSWAQSTLHEKRDAACRSWNSSRLYRLRTKTRKKRRLPRRARLKITRRPAEQSRSTTIRHAFEPYSTGTGRAIGDLNALRRWPLARSISH